MPVEIDNKFVEYAQQFIKEIDEEYGSQSWSDSVDDLANIIARFAQRIKNGYYHD